MGNESDVSRDIAVLPKRDEMRLRPKVVGLKIATPPLMRKIADFPEPFSSLVAVTNKKCTG